MVLKPARDCITAIDKPIQKDNIDMAIEDFM